MKITNNFKLPESLVRAVENHTHKGGDYSASQLGKSPREYWLNKRHHDKLTSDVSDNIWALFGTAVHYVLEKSATENQITEQYMSTEIEGKTFSGTSDCLEQNETGYTVIDYKTTSVWSIVYKDRIIEWEKQLNSYAYLFKESGFDITEIKVIAILRDWQKSKAKFDPNYPQSQVVEITIPVWETEAQKNYIAGCIRNTELFKDIPDNELPLCTDEELWKSPAKFAIMKDGRKSAVRVLDSNDDAVKYIEDKKLDEKHSIVERKSKAKKCLYCNCTAVCEQYKTMLENGEVDE
jgi:hypothetical protein